MDTVQIPLVNRFGEVLGHTLVDAEDAECVRQWTWRLMPRGYASRSDPSARGQSRTVYLHRQLLGLAKGDPRHADHINRDRLDNRRANLRIVTPGQNRQNTAAIGGYSRHRGVTFHKGEHKWQAQAQLDGKNTTIGRYASEEEADRIVRAWRREHMPFSEEASA